MNHPRRRLVILGLDGVGWSLLADLAGQGVTPHWDRLRAQAHAGPMTSTWPEISPVAWTTFCTGRNPGEHGIYGFTDFEPGRRRVRLMSSADVAAPPIWDWLSLRNRESVVLNVPLTYPARSLRGVMVSGFVALDLARAVYPSDLAPGLAREGYRLEADFDRVHHDRPAFLKDLTAALAGRNMLFNRFWAKDWDLFFLVVTDTDRLLHFMYREYLEGGPIRNYFLDFFHQVDRLVGRVAEETERRSSPESPVALALLSDHGFCPTNGEFHLNRWLAANGFQRDPGPEARVLALDPTRLYLNRPPRFPEGRVRPSEADRLAGELTAALAREPAVAGVLEGKNLYYGPQAFRSPDLVVQPARGYEFKAKFNAGPVYTPSPLMGTHSHQDAFYLVRNFHEHPAPPAIAAIQDLGAWIFSYFSL